MFNLVRNENLKLAKRISTWIMVGILILITLAAAIIIKVDTKHDNNINWKQRLTAQNVEMKKELADPRNSDFANYNKKQIALNEYSIKHNIAPDNGNTLWGFAEGGASMISIIALFAIIMGGGIVANEFSAGTIKLLLIRPSKRWKILLSKYISVLSYIIMMLVILFVASFLLGGIFFSFNGATQPFLKYSNGTVTEVNMFLHIMQTYGLECASLIMMVTFAFMISSVFRSSSLAIGIGVFLMFAGSILVQLLSRFDWSKYILFANTNLKQYINGTPPVKGMTMSFSISVLIVYFIIFNIIAFTIFNKRDVAA